MPHIRINAGSLSILFLIALVWIIPCVSGSTGQWVLTDVIRESDGRDDVSTMWDESSDNAIAGKTTWQWASMDCRQTIASTFSWTTPPLILTPYSKHDMVLRIEEQACTQNCHAGGSELSYWSNNPRYLGQGSGGAISVGCENGIVKEEKYMIDIGQPTNEYMIGNDVRDWAIKIEARMYHEKYTVLYYYSWVEGDADISGLLPLISPGAVWSVKEAGPMGNYDGKWVILDDGETIDATWGGISDIIDIISTDGNTIALYRRGNDGYYTGTISSDGRSISGTGSWYSVGQTWNVSI